MPVGPLFSHFTEDESLARVCRDDSAPGEGTRIVNCLERERRWEYSGLRASFRSFKVRSEIATICRESSFSPGVLGGEYGKYACFR